MEAKERSSLRKAEAQVFSKMKPGEIFSPPGFKVQVCEIAPQYKFKYLDTFMRIARMHFRHLYRCVNRSKSIYQYIGETK